MLQFWKNYLSRTAMTSLATLAFKKAKMFVVEKMTEIGFGAVLGHAFLGEVVAFLAVGFMTAAGLYMMKKMKG